MCVRWWDGDEQFTAWPRLATSYEREEHRSLVEAVNSLKVQHSGQGGGAFRINEYGQVIVPTGMGGAGSAFCPGRVNGAITFEHPDGYIFDLCGRNAAIGDVWDKPVVAFRYIVRNDDTISFESHPDSLTREWHRLPSPQPSFASAARSVRGQQGFALFVNDQGAAVVKCAPNWTARYVGEIDLGDWFDEECCP